MLAHLCDGCGSELGECHDCGLVLKCEYCSSCCAVYAEFEAERDRLHEKLAQAWQDALGQLKDRYADRLKHMPDSNSTSTSPP